MNDITPNTNPRTLADSPVVTTGTDSDRSYTEYKWGFSGTAPYNENAFTQRIEGEILAEGNLITIAVASDDTATVSIAGIGSASSSLGSPGSASFFKSDGSKFSGRYAVTIDFETIGGPWMLDARVSVSDAVELPPKQTCECSGTCDSAPVIKSGSVDFSQPFGGTPFAAGFPKGALRIYDRIPVRELFSGAGLRYVHPMTRRVREISGTTVVIEDALHTPYTYENGRPAGTAVWTDNQLESLGGGRFAETLPDRTRVTYGADGNVEKIRSPEGVELTPAQLGIEAVFDSDGNLVQVWSLTDGLAEVVSLGAKKFRLDWYKPADVVGKDGQTGRYARTGTPIKAFTFGDVDGDGDCGVFELLEERAGTDFAFHYAWRYDAGKKDWVFVRGNEGDADSETSQKEKIFWKDADGADFVTVKEWKRTGNGARTLVSTEVYSYGADGEMLVSRRLGDNEDFEFTATRVAEGNGRGKFAEETDKSGARTTYDYDACGRTTRTVRTKGYANETEETLYVYEEAPASGAADPRPRTVVHKIAGTVFKT
ncbi:MAG: hypothetical protein ACI4P3_01565, partial [Candidatus Spyradosoma sp.]